MATISANPVGLGTYLGPPADEACKVLNEWSGSMKAIGHGRPWCVRKMALGTPVSHNTLDGFSRARIVASRDIPPAGNGVRGGRRTQDDTTQYLSQSGDVSLTAIGSTGPIIKAGSTEVIGGNRCIDNVSRTRNQRALAALRFRFDCLWPAGPVCSALVLEGPPGMHRQGMLGRPRGSSSARWRR